MKKVILQSALITVLALPNISAFAQYTYDWAKRLAGAHTDWAYDIALDNDGNVISSGSFMIAADFDPSDEGVAEMTSADNDGHAYISKLDADGNYVWARSLSGKSSGRAVITDQAGNVYAGGSFGGSFDFDGGVGEIVLTSNGLNDAFIAKYSPDGDLLWAKSFGGQHHDGIVRMAINANGDIAVCGYFVYTVDFDPDAGITEVTAFEFAGANDVFISMFDSDGNFQWMHHMGGESSQSPNDIAFDSQGNVLVTGNFAYDMNCDPGSTDFTFEATGGSDWDIFIAKLNNDGDFQWAKRIGGMDQDVGYGIAVDANNNIIATGHFGLTVDFDPSAGVEEFTVSGSWYDIFVSKMDADGNFIWARQMASAENDYGASVAVDGGGNIYTTGYTGGNCDLDPGTGTAEVEWEGGADIFISVLDVNGEYLWGENFGAHEDDWGNAIKVDDNHIYVTGLYRENYADFGGSYLMGAGNEDAFVFKLTHPPFSHVAEMNDKGLTMFPNPASDKLSVDLDTNPWNEPVQVIISDCHGKVVWRTTKTVLSNHFCIDVSQFSEGVYSVSLEGKQTNATARIVIAR